MGNIVFNCPLHLIPLSLYINIWIHLYTIYIYTYYLFIFVYSVIHLFIYSIHLFICLSIYSFLFLFIFLCLFMFISISICMFILFFMCLFTYLFTSEYTLYLAEWNKNHQLQHSWNVRPFGDDSLDPKSHSSDVTVMSLQFMYPLVNLQKKLWKITMFNGKTHYKWPFSIAMLVYQRVCILTV